MKFANVYISKAKSARRLPESGFKSTFGKLLGGRAEEEKICIDNLLVRIHFIEMIWWTGLAPWEFDFF